MHYKHLSPEDRYYIEIENKKGSSKTVIAKSLGRSESSIYRELKRNAGERGYRHKQAHKKASLRHLEKPKAIKMTDEIKNIINGLIRDDWSPEQISGRLKMDGTVSLHHETIYQHILADKKAGGTLYMHLRHQNKTYRKRYGNPRSRNGIPNRVDIEERPEVANKRERVGDWEADTIIGKNHKGAIVTLDERKTKLRLAFPLNSKRACGVTGAIALLLTPLKELVKTMTFDNGKEFAHHEQIATALDCDTYFAKPYHSWERGQNENANGLLRQYFPKAMELIDIKSKEVFEAVSKLNNRPRKCLGYKTPIEVFKKMTGVDIEGVLEKLALMT